MNVYKLMKWPILTLYFSCFLTACVGPKLFSESSASQEIWEKQTSIRNISVRPLPIFAESDTTFDTYTPLLFEKIKEHLKNNPEIEEVKILSPTDSAKTHYLLEVSVMNIGGAGWKNRALYDNTKSEVSIAGRIIDVASDKAIITFRKTRMAQGGLLGMGGWLSAGEKKMSQKLIDWLAGDIVELLLNPTAAISPSNRKEAIPSNEEEF